MKRILVDTNLIVLLVVGLTDRNLIGRHKRTQNFMQSDFDLLSNLLNTATEIWITSHCLAEASNLIGQTNPTDKSKLFSTFRLLLENTEESHIHKSDVLINKNFHRLGVADCGFIQKSKRVDLTITADLALFLEIEKLYPKKVLNFNRFRDL